MKNRIKIAALLLALACSGTASPQETDKVDGTDLKRECRQMAQTMAERHEWVGVDMRMERFCDGMPLFTHDKRFIFHYADDFSIFYHQKDFEVFSCLTKKHFRVVDKQNLDLIQYDNDETDTLGNFLTFGVVNGALRETMGFPFFVYPTVLGQAEVFPLSYYGKTVMKLHQKDYLVYSATSEIEDSSNPGRTLKGDLRFFIDTSTGLLDSVYAVHLQDDNRYESYYSFGNFDFSNRQAYIDSVFNFDAEAYSRYSKNKAWNSTSTDSGTYGKRTESELLRFPVVSLKNDTLNLSNANGWILLNFWTFNCPPCIQNLMHYGHERDSLGCRVLEKHGIAIWAVNYMSDNMDLIARIGEKTGCSDIVYSAKGMNNFFTFNYLGYYYLFAPNKEIVFETWDLGDYSKLLKAKADYEKQNQSK